MKEYADAPTSAVVSGLNDNYGMLSQINQNLGSASNKAAAASVSAAASASAYASTMQAQQRASAALIANSADKVFAAAQAGMQSNTQQAQKHSAEHLAEIKKLREEIVSMKKITAQGLASAVAAQGQTTAAVEINTKTMKKQPRPATIK
jgi:hypothetical protein